MGYSPWGHNELNMTENIEILSKYSLFTILCLLQVYSKVIQFIFIYTSVHNIYEHMCVYI